MKKTQRLLCLLTTLILLLAQLPALADGYVPLTQQEIAQARQLIAMEGDIHLAEPGATIGFAGPRVIEQTIGEKLPDGFQRSEFQLEHGFVDQVVPRTELKEVLTRILQLHTRGRKRR